MLHHHRPLINLTLGAAMFWAACAGPRPTARPQEGAELPVPDTAVATGTEARQDPAATMLGRWSLASRPAGEPPGIRIIVLVDSARGERFFGRLSSMFSGNVGIDPAGFGAFRGRLAADGRASFTIPTTDQVKPGLTFAGRLDGDTLTLDVFALGGDTLSTATRRWYLVRRR